MVDPPHRPERSEGMRPSTLQPQVPRGGDSRCLCPRVGAARGRAARGGRRRRTFLGLVLLCLALVVEAHGALVHAVGLHAVLAAEATRVVWGKRGQRRTHGRCGGTRPGCDPPRGPAHTAKHTRSHHCHTSDTGHQAARPFCQRTPLARQQGERPPCTHPTWETGCSNEGQQAQKATHGPVPEKTLLPTTFRPGQPGADTRSTRPVPGCPGEAGSLRGPSRAPRDVR